VALEEAKDREEPKINITPTLKDIPAEEKQVVSQLKYLEQVISKDASLLAKFNAFQTGWD